MSKRGGGGEADGEQRRLCHGSNNLNIRTLKSSKPNRESSLDCNILQLVKEIQNFTTN